MNLSQAIAARGLDEKREIRNLNRRLRYQGDPHAGYHFPADRLQPEKGFWAGQHAQYNAGILAMRQYADLGLTDQYVSAWCRANHLKEA